MSFGKWQVVGATRDRLGESPLWHPREQALYWIDFYGPTVHRDGLCVDSAGMIYCAHYGGGRVTRFGPGGEHLEVLALSVRNVTSCCLGGPHLNVLYVTTAENGGAHHLDGALFATKVAVAGLPEPIFSGNVLANGGRRA